MWIKFAQYGPKEKKKEKKKKKKKKKSMMLEVKVKGRVQNKVHFKFQILVY